MVKYHWCGGQGHTRVSSKKYVKHSEWKKLKTVEAKHEFQKAECSKSPLRHIVKLKWKYLRKAADVTPRSKNTRGKSLMQRGKAAEFRPFKTMVRWKEITQTINETPSEYMVCLLGETKEYPVY